MSRGPSPAFRAFAIAAALYSLGCAGETGARRPALEPRAPLAASSMDDSPICKSLADRFIGLPASSEEDSRSMALAPLAGTWWIRSCSAKRSGDELQVTLQGPGWYWVEESESGIAVRQQVPFQLRVELDGRLRNAMSGGVFSLWFEPAREPRIQLTAPERLRVHSSNAWGWMLQLVPLASPGRVAADRFSERLTVALHHRLRDGATVTFDAGSGQADAGLGRLEAGHTPHHPFEDGVSWIVNDRLFLAPAATQVVGPIDPGATSLDVAIESGSGVNYNAVCSEDLSANYTAIASGELSQVPKRAWAATGKLGGLGRHSAAVQVDGCKFYLVLSTAGPLTTLAALRVRA